MKRNYTIVITFALFLTFTTLVFRELKILKTRSVLSDIAFNELLTDEYVNKNILNSIGYNDVGATSYVFNNQNGQIPKSEINSTNYESDLSDNVLGNTTEEKKIIVDLNKQRVYAYEGDRKVLNFLVSTGLWGRTPVGNYRIWYKVRSQTMKGGNPDIGTYYYLPNVQWIQYFNKGIGFHSTYWHNNFGHPMSHGCVNMTTLDAQTLYKWANPVVPSGLKIFRPTISNPGTEVKVVDSWNI